MNDARRIFVVVATSALFGAACARAALGKGAAANEAQRNVEHPVFPPQYAKRDVPGLEKQVAPVMALSERRLYDLVPSCSGIYYCGCPNCEGGSQDGGLTWKLSEPNRVRCRHCGMVFPHEKYPLNKEIQITAPSGTKQVYRYHESAGGRQFFFEARAWFAAWGYFNRMGLLLANLHALTGKTEYADRAAIIIGRFAQVFPDYAIRYDYPYRPVRFWPADTPSTAIDFTPYRAAKYYWWAYGDVPAELIRAYDLIHDSGAFRRKTDLLGAEVRQRIEKDFFHAAVVWTMGHRDSYGNMSPGMYHDFVVAGRVLGEPRFVHEAVERARTLMDRQFFFDGWWREGSPSYHAQTIGNMMRVVNVAKGYTDPPGYEPPKRASRLEKLDLGKSIPMIGRALEVNDTSLLPNGRLIPINDTWWFSKRPAPKENPSRLWAGVGHAVLAGGKRPTAFQVHLNWSGGYGHTHHDNGSVILFAHGKELLSDIGYTHTKWRNWTLNSASHNLVVVDARSQRHGELIRDLTDPKQATRPSDGNLLLMDRLGAPVQVVEVDATPAYKDRCTRYRRTLVHVHPADGQDYVLDVFDVVGGTTHDYFLHGCADEDGSLTLSVPCAEAVETLVPSWGGRETYHAESDLDLAGKRYHAYGFLRDIRAGRPSGSFVASFAVKESDVGLRAHVLSYEGLRVFSARSPSVRRARSSDAKLDDYWMPTLILRRQGEKLTSRFIAVLEPTRGEPFIQAVRRIDHARSVVIEVDRGGVIDLIVVAPKTAAQTEVDVDGKRLTLVGRVGVVALDRAGARWAYMLDATRLEYDRLVLGTQGPWSGALLATDSANPNRFVTEASPATGGTVTGQVAIVAHGQGRTHGYVVKRVLDADQGRTIETEGHLGFDYDAAAKRTTFRTFPHWRIAGPAHVNIPSRQVWIDTGR